jgi:hypothetical protein
VFTPTHPDGHSFILSPHVRTQTVSSASGQQSEQEEVQAVTVKSVQTKRSQRRGAKVEETVTMETIRVRVLRLLGRVGGRQNIKVRVCVAIPPGTNAQNQRCKLWPPGVNNASCSMRYDQADEGATLRRYLSLESPVAVKVITVNRKKKNTKLKYRY